ncbi:hypothetical protein EWM60_06305 [Candidatus Erwinia dacicola]|nr:hypothetical protein [Candidatus Erwinia dacicola]
MARSAPRYVVKLHDDEETGEDAAVLRFDEFDDAVSGCDDLNIPFFESGRTCCCPAIHCWVNFMLQALQAFDLQLWQKKRDRRLFR